MEAMSWKIQQQIKPTLDAFLRKDASSTAIMPGRQPMQENGMTEDLEGRSQGSFSKEIVLNLKFNSTHDYKWQW